MARTMNRLTVKAINNKGAGKYSDGGGLWLHKRSGEKDDGQWFLRVTVHGRRREMGLGGMSGRTLAEVRDEAAKWRAIAKSGKDPIKERERQKREAERNLHLLRDVAADAFETRKAELKGDGKAGRWFSPLELHVLPKLGGIPVADLDQIDIRNTLAPIWHSKASTAEKALHRLGVCIRHAAALGLNVDMQAVDKARALLGKQRHTVKNIPSLPWQELPEFYASLNEGTVTQLALRLLILTAVRSKPLRYLREEQIDDDVWTIPPELVKGRRDATTEFRVPLSKEAKKVIAQARVFSRDGYLFPSVRKGVISDATMSRYMERLGLDARPHGFRSSFKNWCSETQSAPFEVSEMSLGHAVGGKVERSYKRTDFLDQRRELMRDWAAFMTTSESIKMPEDAADG